MKVGNNMNHSPQYQFNIMIDIKSYQVKVFNFLLTEFCKLWSSLWPEYEASAHMPGEIYENNCAFPISWIICLIS